MPLRVVTFKLTDDDLSYIDMIANEIGVARSTIIRCAIAYLIVTTTGQKLSMYKECSDVLDALVKMNPYPVSYKYVRLES